MRFPEVRLPDGTATRVSLIWLNYGEYPMTIQCLTQEPDFGLPVEDPQVVHILSEGLPRALVSIDFGEATPQRVQLVKEHDKHILLCYPCD